MDVGVLLDTVILSTAAAKAELFNGNDAWGLQRLDDIVATIQLIKSIRKQQQHDRHSDSDVNNPTMNDNDDMTINETTTASTDGTTTNNSNDHNNSSDNSNIDSNDLNGNNSSHSSNLYTNTFVGSKGNYMKIPTAVVSSSLGKTSSKKRSNSSSDQVIGGLVMTNMSNEPINIAPRLIPPAPQHHPSLDISSPFAHNLQTYSNHSGLNNNIIGTTMSTTTTTTMTTAPITAVATSSSTDILPFLDQDTNGFLSVAANTITAAAAASVATATTTETNNHISSRHALSTPGFNYIVNGNTDTGNMNGNHNSALSTDNTNLHRNKSLPSKSGKNAASMIRKNNLNNKSKLSKPITHLQPNTSSIIMGHHISNELTSLPFSTSTTTSSSNHNSHNTIMTSSDINDCPSSASGMVTTHSDESSFSHILNKEYGDLDLLAIPTGEEDDLSHPGLNTLSLPSAPNTSITTTTMGLCGPPLSQEEITQIDQVFFDFLAKVCGDQNARDASYQKLHHTLTAKKMNSFCEELTDFHTFKFRIKAFRNAFHGELRKHPGFSEISLSQVIDYLNFQRYVARFSPEGKRLKSNGSFVWAVQARKAADDGWIFREFERDFTDDKTDFYLSSDALWAYSPRIYDPQQCS